MDENSQLEIIENIFIKADPILVFEFFTDAALIARWHGVDAETDPRPGGIFRLNVTGEDYKVGEFVEVDPPRRVVFTWGHPDGVDNFPPASSTVTVTLEAAGGGTNVRVHQTGFPDTAQRNSHSIGWRHYLERLIDVAEGRNPGRDPWRKIA